MYLQDLEEILKQEKSLGVHRCLACGRCTALCPVGSLMSMPPHQLVHLMRINALGELLEPESLFYCTDCGRCTEACPSGIDVNRILNLDKAEIRSGKIPGLEKLPRKARFNRDFLQMLRKGEIPNPARLAVFFSGKVNREGLKLRFKLWSKGWLKMPPPPHPKIAADLKKIFRSITPEHKPD